MPSAKRACWYANYWKTLERDLKNVNVGFFSCFKHLKHQTIFTFPNLILAFTYDEKSQFCDSNFSFKNEKQTV